MHGGEAHEDRGYLFGVLEETGLGQFAMVAVALEVAVGTGTSGVDDTLGNALVVEVGDLLAHDEVFKQRRPTRPSLEAVLVVGNLHPLVGP
ncbi:hypothetical protein D3C79_990800 [compost metagenome]